MRHGLEPGLENTMQSLEDFVEDSVSTVYARSASGSEVSWTWSDHVSCGDNDVQLKVPSASGQFKLEYLQNPDRTISAEDQAAKDIDFSFDEASGEDYMSLRELLAGLKTLDELQIHRLAMQASRHRANNLLKRLIMIYGHDIVAPQGFDELNSTPLLWATCNGHRSTMKLLLRNGANIDHRDNKGISPLLLALIAGKEDAALLLMQRGANTTDLLQSGYHYHLLNIAAMHNCVKVMAHVFLKGATEASTSFEGSTALHGAVIAGSLEAATFLLDYGFNIEARDHGAGWTPLMFACSGMIDDYANGRIWTWSVLSKPTTLIKLLLQRGADINAVGRDKMTPLRVAIHFKKFDVLRLLLEYGVKQDIKSRLWLVAHAKDLGLEVEKQERAVKYFRR
jgi:ankyrin repeat protein